MPVATDGICGAVDMIKVGGPAPENLFPTDALLELVSFLPHGEVRREDIPTVCLYTRALYGVGTVL